MLKITKMFRTAKQYSSKQRLVWKQDGNMIEILIGQYVFIFHQKQTFKDLRNRKMNRFEFLIPKTLTQQAQLAKVLRDSVTPVQIKVNFMNQSYSLLNRAAYPQTTAIKRNISNPKGILQSYDFSIYESSKAREFLTQYYLRLQAQAYFKSKNTNLKTSMTPEIASQLVGYLIEANVNNQQQNMIKLRQKMAQIQLIIKNTQLRIQELTEKADRILGMYKWGIVALLAAHIVAFAYMIFGVQFLGWDFIEPLTFSVGTLYLLVALRFYRKFYKDRNMFNIRNRFRHFALKPQKRMNLIMLRDHLQKQKADLQSLKLRYMISRNRITPTTTYLSKFK